MALFRADEGGWESGGRAGSGDGIKLAELLDGSCVARFGVVDRYDVVEGVITCALGLRRRRTTMVVTVCGGGLGAFRASERLYADFCAMSADKGRSV